MKFNSKNRTKRIMVWVSDEEKTLLETKAEYYGYKTFAAYIRDSAIYEKVVYVDLDNRKEIYNAYSENTKELKKITKELRHLNKYATQLKNEDVRNINSMIFTVIKKQKDMLELINKKLNLKVWQEINYNKNRME